MRLTKVAVLPIICVVLALMASVAAAIGMPGRGYASTLAAPAAPVITSPANNSFEGSSFYIEGTAQTGATVEVFDGTMSLGTTSVDFYGEWYLHVSGASEGTHTYTAKATDSTGTSPASAAVSVTVDTTKPSPPVITSPARGSTLSTSSFSVTGTAEPRSTVVLYEDWSIVGQTLVSSTGTWSISLAGVADGVHEYLATAEDRAGNTSNYSAEVSVTVETGPPAAPTIDAPNNGSYDNTGDLDFSGNAEPNSTVELFEGTTSKDTTTADSSGNWYISLYSVTEGSHTYTARARDAAGNTSVASDTRTVIVDTKAPAAPTLDLATTSDTGVSSTDKITNDSTPTFNGSAEVASKIKIYDGTTLLGTVTATSTGTWDFTSAILTNDTHSITASSTDVAGNTSLASTVLSVMVDTLAPALTIPSHSLVANTTLGASTVPVRVSWSGTDGGSGVAKYQVQRKPTGGVWTWVTQGTTARTLTLQLAPGGHQFQVRGMDKAGNWSAWKQGPSFSVNAYQETSTVSDGKVSYSGTWGNHSLTSYFGGSVKYAGTKGATASFTFTGGRQVAWVAPKGSNRGYADVYLDEAKVATINLYTSSAQYRKVVYAKGGLNPSVTHTLKVYVTGTKPTDSTGTRVDLDGFVVIR